MDTSIADAAAFRNATLEEHLGYWLRRVSNHVSGAFQKALQERQVSVAEWVVLSQIEQHPGIRPAELADTTGLTRGAISKVLEKLETKRWIARKTLETDLRGQVVVLTQYGRRALPELKAIADRNDERFFSCLRPDEKATLETLLRRLAVSNQIQSVPVE